METKDTFFSNNFMTNNLFKGQKPGFDVTSHLTMIRKH